MRLDGKVALVTGAARGLGRVIAGALAGAGARVMLSDVDASGLDEAVDALRAAGHDVGGEVADVSDEASVAGLFEACVSRFDGIDILVNNAGRAGQVDFLDLTADAWDRVLATNLRGVYLCSRAAALQMVAQGRGGRIINVTSALGVKGAKRSAHYAASKGGVNAFTRSIAYELAPHGIEVIAAGPGQTDTPMWRSMYPEAEQEERRRAGQVQPPEDFAGLIVFLASDAAKGLGGQVIAKGVYIPT